MTKNNKTSELIQAIKLNKRPVKKTITLRVNVDLIKTMKEVCHTHNISLTDLIEGILKETLNNN